MSRKFDFDDDDLALDESSDDGVSMAILKADPAAVATVEVVEDTTTTTTSATTTTTTAATAGGAQSHGLTRTEATVSVTASLVPPPTGVDFVSRATANHTFKPTKKKHLGFTKGDTLFLVSRIEGKEWWNAADADGGLGIVPANYITIVESEVGGPDDDGSDDGSASTSCDTVSVRSESSTTPSKSRSGGGQASGGEAELEWNMEEIKAPASTGAADATVAAGADASVNSGDGTSSGGGKPSAAATNDASRESDSDVVVAEMNEVEEILDSETTTTTTTTTTAAAATTTTTAATAATATDNTTTASAVPARLTNTTTASAADSDDDDDFLSEIDFGSEASASTTGTMRRRKKGAEQFGVDPAAVTAAAARNINPNNPNNPNKRRNPLTITKEASAVGNTVRTMSGGKNRHMVVHSRLDVGMEGDENLEASGSGRGRAGGAGGGGLSSTTTTTTTTVRRKYTAAELAKIDPFAILRENKSTLMKEDTIDDVEVASYISIARERRSRRNSAFYISRRHSRSGGSIDVSSADDRRQRRKKARAKARLEKLQRQQARAMRRLARHERAARERRRFAPANEVRDAVPPPGTSNYLPSMETAAEFEIALAEMREVEAALRLKRRFHGWLEELLDGGPLTYWETLYADELTEWETFGEGARWKGRFRTGQPTFADNASAQLAELDAMADKIARQKKEKNKKRAWTKLKMLILMGAFRDRTEDNVEDLMRGMEDIIAAMNAETDHADPLDAIVADHADDLGDHDHFDDLDAFLERSDKQLSMSNRSLATSGGSDAAVGVEDYDDAPVAALLALAGDDADAAGFNAAANARAEAAAAEAEVVDDAEGADLDNIMDQLLNFSIGDGANGGQSGNRTASPSPVASESAVSGVESESAVSGVESESAVSGVESTGAASASDSMIDDVVAEPVEWATAPTVALTETSASEATTVTTVVTTTTTTTTTEEVAPLQVVVVEPPDDSDADDESEGGDSGDVGGSTSSSSTVSRRRASDDSDEDLVVSAPDVSAWVTVGN